MQVNTSCIKVDDQIAESFATNGVLLGSFFLPSFFVPDVRIISRRDKICCNLTFAANQINIDRCFGGYEKSADSYFGSSRILVIRTLVSSTTNLALERICYVKFINFAFKTAYMVITLGSDIYNALDKPTIDQGCLIYRKFLQKFQMEGNYVES